MSLNELLKHAETVYTNGESFTISNQTYNALTNTIGYVKVPILVGDLDLAPYFVDLPKLNSIKSLKQWFNKYQNVEFCIQPKIKGVSVILHYKGDEPVKVYSQRKTDSRYGLTHDATEIMALTMTSAKIPTSLNTEDEYLVFGVWSQELEESQDKSLKSRFAHATLNHKFTAIDIVPLSTHDEFDIANKEYMFTVELLETLGFTVPPTETLDVFGIVKRIDLMKKNVVDFEMVIKPNIHNVFDGGVVYTTDMLYKVGKILSIDWSMSDLGTLTPVGVIEPLDVNDVVISRVCLKTPEFIVQLGLCEQDYVLLRCSNANILTFCKPIPSLNKSHGKHFEVIKNCPYCNHPLTRTLKGSLQCQNDLCVEQFMLKLGNSFKSLGIRFLKQHSKGLDGFKVLFNAGKIKSIFDVLEMLVKDEGFEEIEEFVKTNSSIYPEFIALAKQVKGRLRSGLTIQEKISLLVIEGIRTERTIRNFTNGINNWDEFINQEFLLSRDYDGINSTDKTHFNNFKEKLKSIPNHSIMNQF